MPYVGAPRPPTTVRSFPTTKTPSAWTLPSARAAPGTRASFFTSDSGTVRVDGSPLRVALPAGRTTTSPTDEPKSRLNPSLRAAENTSDPTTNATPSEIAKVLIISRTLRASRIFQAARIIGGSHVGGLGRLGGGHPRHHLLAVRVEELVDDPAVREEHDAVGVRRRHGVMRDHHDGLVVIVDAAPEELEDLGSRPAVEVAGRLVGEHDLRPDRKSTRLN